MRNVLTLKRVKEKIVQGWPTKSRDLGDNLKDFWAVQQELSINNNKVMVADRLVPP